MLITTVCIAVVGWSLYKTVNACRPKSVVVPPKPNRSTDGDLFAYFP